MEQLTFFPGKLNLFVVSSRYQQERSRSVIALGKEVQLRTVLSRLQIKALGAFPGLFCLSAAAVLPIGSEDVKVPPVLTGQADSPKRSLSFGDIQDGSYTKSTYRFRGLVIHHVYFPSEFS